MNLNDFLGLLTLLLSCATLIIVLLRKDQSKNSIVLQETLKIGAELNKIDPLIRSEFSMNREELQKQSRDSREELSTSVKNLSDQLSKTIIDLSNNQKAQFEGFSDFLKLMISHNDEKFEKLTKSTQEKQNEFKEQLINGHKEVTIALTDSLKNNDEKIALLVKDIGENSKALNELLTASMKDNRSELTLSLKSFEDQFKNNVKDFNELQRTKFGDLFAKQDQTKKDTEAKLDKIRETVEGKLTILQQDNNKKLEEMRMTVDEKLQATLEKRFNESFTVISERLELVHKGLGEMQALATSVGDIKKVMTNVKSRGVMGEYQLANLLEDLLTNEQYEKNVKTKVGSGVTVEFAIKLPNNNHSEKTLWLPIDSKFPKEDYESLVDAYEEGDPGKLEQYRKAFKNSIVKSAKEIREKYIDPPNTTEYGIMFLPFESLYAEVLRTPGLFEHLQRDYKITITGPTTLSALLNSLQMGFRTLAIEKRSSDVWNILSGVKKEFGTFGTLLENTSKKLQVATNVMKDVGIRSRAIERKLKEVESLPAPASAEEIPLLAPLDLQEEVENLLTDNEN